MIRHALLTASACLFLGGCATPDSVRLQSSKIDQLQRSVDKLSGDMEKLNEKIQGAVETAKKAGEKADAAGKQAENAMQLLQRR